MGRGSLVFNGDKPKKKKSKHAASTTNAATAAGTTNDSKPHCNPCSTMADKAQSLPVEALQKTLASNKAVQEQIKEQLNYIEQRKRANRCQAARLSLSNPASSRTQHRNPPLPEAEWRARYFVQKRSTVGPEPNQDEVRRRQCPTFSAERNPLWGLPENRKLLAHLETDNGPPDYETIAKEVSTKKCIRSAEDCRIQLRNLKKSAPWTDDETKKLLQLVKEAATPVNWKLIATGLGTDRTAWQVFRQYKAKISKHVSLWTPLEDEFLLKFIAANGPQYDTFSGEMNAFVAARFLPSKTRSRILHRANRSLLNPILLNEAWGEEDERKLVLCMRVYSQEASKDPPVKLSSRHIPWRSRSAIVDKWERCLNPAFLTEPFTQSEDQEMMQVLRANPRIGWKELSLRFFPRRHPHRLMNRWSEIAKDQDILDRFEDKFLEDQVANDEDGKRKSTSASEYVVKVKKAKQS
jgi:hypothetical protein